MKIFVEAHNNMKQSKALKLLMLKSKLFTFTYMYIHCITFLGIRFYCIIYIPYTMIIWIGSLTSSNRVNFVRFRLTSHVKVTYWCQMSKKKCWLYKCMLQVFVLSGHHLFPVSEMIANLFYEYSEYIFNSTVNLFSWRKISISCYSRKIW